MNATEAERPSRGMLRGLLFAALALVVGVVGYSYFKPDREIANHESKEYGTDFSELDELSDAKLLTLAESIVNRWDHTGATSGESWELDKARKYVDRVLEHAPGHPLAQLIDARLIYRTKHKSTDAGTLAMDKLRSIKVDDATVGKAETFAAQLLLDQRGDREEVVRRLKAAIALDSSNPWSLFYLGDVELRGGNFRAAAVHLDSIAENERWADHPAYFHALERLISMGKFFCETAESPDSNSGQNVPEPVKKIPYLGKLRSYADALRADASISRHHNDYVYKRVSVANNTVIDVGNHCRALKLASAPAATRKDAGSPRQEIKDHIWGLFRAGDFEAINALDSDYRASESRLPEGLWKLSMLYDSFGKAHNALNETDLARTLNLVEQWIARTPNRAAPYLVKTEILMTYAWSVRGTGYVDTVSDWQWEQFHQHVAAARETLESSATIASGHPQWFFRMETIALAQKWPVEEFDALYRAAVDASPAYYPIHFAGATYYQPRWSGTREAFREFVRNAVELSQEREGLSLYARIFWSQSTVFGKEIFTGGNAEWPLMRQGFKDIEKYYPKSIWNLNAYAYFACIAEDWVTVHGLMSKLGDSYEIQIWRSPSFYQRCVTTAKTEAAKGD